MLLAVTFLIAPSVAIAQQKAPDMGKAPDMTKTPDPPKSPAAVKARGEYDAAVKKLEEEFQKNIAEVKEKYSKDLDIARTEALGAKNLDEAQRILTAQKEISEGLPSNTSIQIVAAWYGWNDRWQDVTQVMKKQIRNGELRLRRAGTGLNDPIVGEYKSLVVIYWQRGVLRVAIAGELSPLTLPGPR